MKRSNKLMHSVSLSALAVAGTIAASSAPVVAQDSSVIEEVIVTARKRSETLQDVPFSINAKTEEAMRNSGVNNLEDLSTQIAGFSIQNLGPGQSQVAMRGISSGQIVRDQPGVKEQVGVYLDESVISLSLFTPDIDLFDMNRVEVLRGPQGTLFGSGSEAGTVRYITNKPNLEESEGVVEAQGSFIDGGEFSGTVKGMINMPIAEGKAALRAVAFYRGFGGYIDAVQPDLSVNEDVNGGRRIGVRVAVEFRPTENLTITPRIVYQDIDIDGFNRQDEYNILANPYTTTRPAVTLGDYEQFTQLEENFTDEFMLLDATIAYDFENMTFTSVTSYTDRDVLQVRDSTQLSGSVIYQFMDQTEGVFNLDAPLYDATDVKVFTQEARLASNSDGPLQWVAGVFYSKIDRNYSQILDVAGFEAATGIPTAGFAGGASTDELFYSRIPYDFKQIALFGEASYDVSERMSVTAGLRWFDFEENRILYFDGIFAAPTDGVPATTKSDGISPRVMVSYEASDNVQINAQASKGFRLGGINDPLNAGACTPEDLATFGGNDSFGNETLWNYEVGAKAKIMDGRGTFNVAAFMTPVSDMQFTVDAGSCSSRVVHNADARSMGVEAELFMRPTDNLEFSLVGSLIDSEVRETVAGAGLVDGGRLPSVPKFQMAGSMTYSQPWGENDAFFSATVQHVGSRFTQAVDAIGTERTVDLTVIPIGAPSATSFAYSTELPSYTTGNLRLGLRNDQWEVALFVNNIWNELAKLAIDRERGTLARVGFLVNQPRTIGLSARAAF